jgi:hypothetical protein
VRARKSREPRDEDVEARAALVVADDVRQARLPLRSCAMTSSATPIVMHASATLNTFGQIVLKSMKSITVWC